MPLVAVTGGWFLFPAGEWLDALQRWIAGIGIWVSRYSR